MLVPRPSRLRQAPSFVVRVSPMAKRAEARELGYATIRRRLRPGLRDASGARRSCRYSLSYPGNSRSSTILYFLHGWLSDDRSWVDRRPNRAIRDRWRQTGAEQPIVASISFGRSWIFGVPSLRQLFLDNVVPRIEAEVAARTGVAIERRLLYGVSMGGINAAYLALNAPEFAERVVAASPAFHDLTPWSSPAEVLRYSRGSRAFTPAVSVATGYARLTMAQQFSNRAEFDVEGDIFSLAQRSLGPATPPLLITSGQYDMFGFDRGADKLLALARANNAQVRLVRLAKGGHAWVPTNPVADFLLAPGSATS